MVKRKKLVFIFILIISVLAAILLSNKTILRPSYIARYPPPQDNSLYDKRFRQIHLDEFMSNSIEKVNLQNCDLTELDLTDKLEILIKSEFDTLTKWPKSLPQSFNPIQVMERGKNPGLQIRNLHALGINGKDIGIAIIDYTLLADHIEYKKRIKLYEEIPIKGGSAHLHGPHMASLAVGKSIGTAPKANLYYIGTSNLGPRDIKVKGLSLDFTNVAKAIYRILEINDSLPESKKIRVISMSMVWAPGNVGYKEINEAIKKAMAMGIFVISCNLYETNDLKFLFHGLDRYPLEDPDSFSVYNVIPWDEWMLLLHPARFPEFIELYEKRIDSLVNTEFLLIPIYSRTFASQNGRKVYTFSRSTGWSMVPPYLAGVYALACQVKPNITPDIFWELALKTGEKRIIHRKEKEYIGKIINPTKLFQMLKDQLH